jgi:hypothetical protein
MVTIAKVPVKMTTPRREEEEIKNLRGSGNRRRKKKGSLRKLRL